jgi:hypothetical protein
VVISPLQPLGAHSDSSTLKAVVTAAPEPASWGMMTLGFGAIGAFLRGRRKPQTGSRSLALTPA